MGIPIEKSFAVKAPAAAVWDFLTDPAKVASCLPGAAITGKLDDQTWGGTITVKVGPVTAAYRGKLRFERLDPAAGEAEIAASGQETRGKGGADMRMKSRVAERTPGETEVTVTSDVNVVGVLAQFGRGMIQDVSDQMFAKFTEAMRRQLEAPVAAGEAASGTMAAGEAAGDTAPAGSAAAGSAAAGTAAAGAAAASTAAAGEVAVGKAVAAAGAAPPAGLSSGPSSAPAAAAENVLDVGALGVAPAGRAAGRMVRRPGF
ncbi:MAG: SRPBCC family protein, partial [Acidobacteria bacterium]|nr:SRPBCC family protein [Acidobacteriota bacterium]